jgi:putative acetyltransferase
LEAGLIIRDEQPGDEDAIHQLTERAFAPMAFADGTEASLIGELRASGDLTLSLVAEIDGRIVGHVAFSPASINGVHADWYGLGPVSVEPDMQRTGIGRALISCGLDRLRSAGAAGCALIGNPKVYGPMGFASDGAISYRDLEARIVQRIVFVGEAPAGELLFAPALEAS